MNALEVLIFKILVSVNGLCPEAYLLYFYIRLECLLVFLSSYSTANVLFLTNKSKHVRDILFISDFCRIFV
jgi:hypothetical protein